jgi:hypothetical protein
MLAAVLKAGALERDEGQPTGGGWVQTEPSWVQRDRDFFYFFFFLLWAFWALGVLKMKKGVLSCCLSDSPPIPCSPLWQLPIFTAQQEK